ncbi:MAG: Crp/Fnr family transcriptional regulator [Clostridiales bacterium]|nr:Crp/Fnr family transcriptional regulator [Clostridiales bacterium]
MQYLESIIESGLFSELKKSDYMDAFEQLKVSGRNYQPGETIFFEGDLIDKFCIVREGSVRSEKTYLNGEVHIVDMFDEGSVFGLAVAASRSRVTAIDYISNEVSTVVFVSMHSIQKNRFSKELQKALTFMLADSNIKMRNKIEILAEKGLRDRVMMYLHVLQAKSGTDTVTVRMSREQLAQFLCVNRSALSNELSKMKKEGIIDFKGPTFKILKKKLMLS